MRVLIIGSEGQLGRAMIEVFAHHELLTPPERQVDVTDRGAIMALADFLPDLIIHAAAMTDVDGCERNPELAYRVNALGTQNVALLAQRTNAVLCYVSTDFVYDGEKGAPYWEWETPRPLNVYGASKLAGEWFVQSLLTRFYIVRTAWLFGPGGNNFPRKVLDLAAKRPRLGMVTREAGHPTYAPHLAEGIARLVQTGAYGLYHLVNQGCVSRFEFARAILDGAGLRDYPLDPLEVYERPARTPARVELQTIAARSVGVMLPPWQEGLLAWLAHEVSPEKTSSFPTAPSPH